MATRVHHVDREQKGDLSVTLHTRPGCGRHCAGAPRLQVADDGSAGPGPEALLFASASGAAGGREADVALELGGCGM